MSARLFVAVVPPDAVLDELERFVEPRREAGPELRWTRPEQWHVTLAFLPSVPEDRTERLGEALSAAAARRTPFELALGGSGAFPDPARAKVLWIGVVGGGELAACSVGARAAANSSGLTVDGAAFRPHVTLARSNRPRNLTRWLRVTDTFASRPWRVDEFVLVESHLGQGPNGRPRYETREAFPLGG